MKEFKTLTLRCDCMGEYVSFDYDEELDMTYLSLTGHQYPLWDRLKLAWKVITQGDWCWREVVLSVESMWKLQTFLLCIYPMKGYDGE